MKRAQVYGQSYFIVPKWVSWDGGALVRQLAVYLRRAEEEPEIFTPFSTFVRESGKVRNGPWQRQHAFAVGSLIDFLIATKGRWDQHTRQDAFMAFAEALVGGTFDRDGRDPTGLAWGGRSVPNARAILACATRFTDWMAQKTGTERLNLLRPGGVAEQIDQCRARDAKAKRSMFSHLRKFRRDRGLVRDVRIDRAPVVSDLASPKVFDKTHLKALLLEGFVRTKRIKSPHRSLLDIARAAGDPLTRFLLRDVLITVLLHGAGLRTCEVFHLFECDVDEDPAKPGHARVMLFHPERGHAPLDPLCSGLRLPDREAYLSARFGLQPRTLIIGGQHAGWKGLLLSDQRRMCAQAHWFPDIWGAIFFELWQVYMAFHRPHSWCRHHPYLFVSEHGKQRGKPYTISSYRQALEQAIERIGLVSGKNEGTTPHGQRHAFGHGLATAGVAARYIQRALHHCSPLSQHVYTAAGVNETNAALSKASRQAAGSAEHALATFLNRSELIGAEE